MRLIDADQFEVIAYKDTAGREDTFDAGVQYMAELIDAAPTVDAVPVVGDWAESGQMQGRCGIVQRNGGKGLAQAGEK